MSEERASELRVVAVERAWRAAEVERRGRGRSARRGGSLRRGGRARRAMEVSKRSSPRQVAEQGSRGWSGSSRTAWMRRRAWGRLAGMRIWARGIEAERVRLRRREAWRQAAEEAAAREGREW